MHYVGRFAPSPTGHLHRGSLATAVASYLDAKANNGIWNIRIDDIDKTRERPGSATNILNTLEAFRFEWNSITYQSKRQKDYQDYYNQLERVDSLYACNCSRKSITQNAQTGIDGLIYPDICRNKKLHLNTDNTAIRIKTNDKPILFKDYIYGEYKQHIHADVGDFVIKRKDNIFAYQFAVCVDDFLEGTTHIVRGADLLNSTARQIYIQKILHFRQPTYIHMPLVVKQTGEKLSKQNDDLAITPDKALTNLKMAMSHLNQQGDFLLADNLSEFWESAINNWSLERIRLKKKD